MSLPLFGAKSLLLSYPDSITAYSATPNFIVEGKQPAFEHFTLVEANLAGIAEIYDEIAKAADLKPAIPNPTTLQDLVQAGRIRLNKERARAENEDFRLALAHVRELKELLRP
jgi:hypothetical protein